MNFLNSIILFGLGAAALPLLIHLLSKRSTKETVFPSIRFLELLKSDRIRMLRIKQLLILFLRTLIVLLIILAFARPALRSVFKSGSRTAAVIIVDNSASMFYVDNGELLFDKALRKAGDILNLLRDDDSAAVIFTGGIHPDFTPGFYTDKNKLLSILKDAGNSYSTGAPESSFSRALDLLNTSGAINKEIYYITDNAQNSLPVPLDFSENSENSEKNETFRLYTVLLGPEKRNGTVIGDITLVDKLIAPGKKLTFSVTRLGDLDGSVNDIEFFVNGERKGKSADTGYSGGSGTAEFSYIPETPGWYSVYAGVNDGYFEPGEKRRMIVYVPAIVNVLLCGGRSDDTFFLEKALMAGSEESVFNVKTVFENDIARANFVWADVIVLSGLSDMPKSEYLSLLGEVVERGKGLLVFPGEDVGTPLYSDGIFRDIFPAKIEKNFKTKENVGNNEKNYTMETFDLTHPVLEGISRKGGFVKPEVKSYLKMNPSPDVRILARFDNNSVGAGVTGCGKGQAIVFAVSADFESGDFPVSGIFSPLIIRSVQYLSGTLFESREYEPEDVFSGNIGIVSADTQVTLKPEGMPSVLVDVENTASGAQISGGEINYPGFYSVFAGTDERERFCVNAPYSEIVFTRAGDMGMSEAYGNFSWKQIHDMDDISEIVTNDRYGRELYGMFMIFAVILICFEMVISRKA